MSYAPKATVGGCKVTNGRFWLRLMGSAGTLAAILSAADQAAYAQVNDVNCTLNGTNTDVDCPPDQSSSQSRLIATLVPPAGPADNSSVTWQIDAQQETIQGVRFLVEGAAVSANLEIENIAILSDQSDVLGSPLVLTNPLTRGDGDGIFVTSLGTRGASPPAATLNDIVDGVIDQAGNLLSGFFGGNPFGDGWTLEGEQGGDGADAGGAWLEVVRGQIETQGTNAVGLLAVSQGGAGGAGGTATGLSVAGGVGGQGGQGGTARVVNSADVVTRSIGILALSQGGAGGAGGFSSGFYANTGYGGDGGDGGDAAARNAGTVTTSGVGAHGLVAVSAGGAAGDNSEYFAAFAGLNNAGCDFFSAVGLDVALLQGVIGPCKNNSGNGGQATVENSGSIETSGGSAYGMWALSRGGEGGGGGDAYGPGTLVAGNGSLGGNGGYAVALNGRTGRVITSGDNAIGILAQSYGGDGTAGGAAGGAAAVGGRGGGTSDGGRVYVSNVGYVETDGVGAVGVKAESTGGGGGGGGDAAGILSLGGKGAGGGNAGAVTLNNSGSVRTMDESSEGLFAISRGGGGGDGGDAVSVGLGFSMAIGGSAGLGGNGSKVVVSNDGVVLTDKNNSSGIKAQSIGGGGGNGGDALSIAVGVKDIPAVSIAVGGSGGAGGKGDSVTVSSGGRVTTEGDGSFGIIAQSIGGGGGDGGDATAVSVSQSVSVSVAIGGSGGDGGDGGIVTVRNDGVVSTEGDRAVGIIAQSIGKGGGTGGSSTSLAAGKLALAVSLGGDGGGAGKGDVVSVTNKGTVQTLGSMASGILASSIGGGGGVAGTAVSGVLSLNKSGTNAAASLSIGGAGGAGKDGGNVIVINDGAVHTSGVQSAAIRALSVGGGGGIGGSTINANGTPFTTGKSINVAVGVAGSGGAASSGGTVRVANNGSIITENNDSRGIYAVSIGGGGGDGGVSTVADISTQTVRSGQSTGLNLQVGVAVGGGGGSCGVGGAVTVQNYGSITTYGDGSDGIFAESVGGGGGSGGASQTILLTKPTTSGSGGLLDKDATRNVTTSVSLGGAGGTGGFGGRTVVENTGLIYTKGASANGIFAQSVGGGGGVGGRANAVTLIAAKQPGDREEQDTKNTNLNFEIVVGGSGGIGNLGGEVEVTNSGNIITEKENSFGIFAQSVGGGGGLAGASARGFSGTLSSLENDTIADILEKSGDLAVIGTDVVFGRIAATKNLTAFVGGTGGRGNHGGSVDVKNLRGSNSAFGIETTGQNAIGIFAQSVGGGGGIGGNSNYNSTQGVSVSGAGGSAGNGGSVTVTNELAITTTGSGSVGIFAQSIGGGGGVAGTLGESGAACAVTSAVVSANIIRKIFSANKARKAGVGAGRDLPGVSLGLVGGSGSAGNGGRIIVNNSGDIYTTGDGSIGILAQSVGGGGGVLAEKTNLGGAGFLTPQFYIGSAGNDGYGESITVTHSGSIYTQGAGAHGILAQSSGGTGLMLAAQTLQALELNANYLEFIKDPNVRLVVDQDGLAALYNLSPNNVGKDITINVNGKVMASGELASAIVADSFGIDGGGRILILIDNAVTVANRSSAATIEIINGLDNKITNKGYIVAGLDGAGWAVVDGVAINAGEADDTVENYGLVRGNVLLGAGWNRLINFEGGEFFSGNLVQLGNGIFENFGSFNPGGSGHIVTTRVLGDFDQSASGKLWVDVDLTTRNPLTDLIQVSGSADVGGAVNLNFIGADAPLQGERLATILTAQTLTHDLYLSFASSPLWDFELRYPDPNSISLWYNVDYTPDGLSGKQSATGEYLAGLLSRAAEAPQARSDQIVSYARGLFALNDVAAIGEAYSRLSPDVYLSYYATSEAASRWFDGSLFHCAESQLSASSRGCAWMEKGQRSFEGDLQSDGVRFEEEADTLSAGIELPLMPKWYFGIAGAHEKTDLTSGAYAQAVVDRSQVGFTLRHANEAGNLGLAVSRGDTGSFGTARSIDADATILARGRPDVSFMSASLRADRLLKYREIRVSPGIEARSTRVRMRAFSETGAGDLGVKAEEGKESFLSIGARLEVGFDWNVGPVTVSPIGRVRASRNIGGKDVDFRSSLIGAPDGLASYESNYQKDDMQVDLYVGAELRSAGPLSGRIGFRSVSGENTEENSFEARLALKF